MIFDLDPDTTLPFSAVRASALLLRSELGRLGLDSWVKTTGGKGLHVVVPLRRRHSWADVGAFSRAFVDSIVDLDPRLFTAIMSKAQRAGRIYLDHLRNRRGATTIAAYSTRARQGAPVALPLLWDELEALDDPAALTAASLNDWLAAHRNDPWMDMLSSRQSLTKEARRRIGVL
jgi:bifunctional non-homologous end joining protein LigD